MITAINQQLGIILKDFVQDTWLAQLEERANLDIGVLSLSPMLDIEIT